MRFFFFFSSSSFSCINISYYKSYEVIIYFCFVCLEMMAHSPKDRSRSPHRNNDSTTNQTNSSSKRLLSTLQSSNQNDTSSQIDTTMNDANNPNNHNNKNKKDSESQLRMKTLKVT